MNDLRLIILVIGLCLIVFIYLWETAKQRRQNRRQTINYPTRESDNYDLKINSGKDADPDYSSVLSDLNQALNRTRQQEDEDVSRILNSELKTDEPAETTDDIDDSGGKIKPYTGYEEGIGKDRIISLYVTARQGGKFSGNEIHQAAVDNGLEFGVLDIYHNFGVGDARMDRPLYSVADMYEPGSFDPDNMDSRHTRGLTLFMCLPCPVDGDLVFDLMLDSARELAERLGGEIRGPDRQILNESHLVSIHRTIAG